MRIEDKKRPWQKDDYKRPNKDPFYQSQKWKSTRQGFKEAPPLIKLKPIGEVPYSNRYCADCWESGRINDERIEIDHVQEIKDGGSPTDHRNLRSRCHFHHNSKTHQERKKRGEG